MIIFWLIGGIAVVTAAFYAPGQNPDLWPNVNMAGFALIAYLFCLVAFNLRKPFSTKAIVTVWIVTLLTGFSIHRAWHTMDQKSKYQKSQLHKVAGSICNGILEYDLRTPLLRILEIYYAQAPEHRQSLQQIFTEKFPGSGPDKNLNMPFRQILFGAADSYDDSTKIFLRSISDSSIVIVGKTINGGGSLHTFRNIDGSHGHNQAVATLTPKGVSYASEN